MEFGPQPVELAEGAVLAHSVRLGSRRLRKGTRLGPAEVAALIEADVDEVWVARLAPDDVDEDSAALELANALTLGDLGLILQPVGTGRVNLLASSAGVARIAAQQVHEINMIDPSITVATVAPFQGMSAAGMVATVKIIAYAVPRKALDRACSAGSGSLGLALPVIRSATLIQTTVGAPDEGSVARAQAVSAARLGRLGVHLTPPCVVAHAIAPLADAIIKAPGEICLVLTASATSDSRDIAPQAVRAAGGRIVHYGMPVDPGNLLFLGEVANRPLVGLPGCARSPALNGADWVIERLLCGVPVDADMIARMGVGGLLKEIATRPQPRQPKI